MDVCFASSLTKSTMSLTKIENLHKRALRFMLHGYQVPTKEPEKNSINFPWTLKENMNFALKYRKL